MENTPTPYQRNRRAGRAEALPEEQANPQSAAPQAVSRQSAYYAPAVPTAPQDGYQAAPRRVPVTPAVHPTDVPSAPHAAGLTSAHPRPVRPANQQPASWQNAPGWNAPTVPPPLQAYQAQQWQNASKTPRQPVQRTYGQPVRTEGTAAYPSAARPGAYAPQQPPVRRAPAPRPHPTAGQDFPLSDDPDVRRSPMREKRRREHADTQPRRNNRAARKQAVPSWLWTILSLALILVMGLIAAEALMHAHLKTAADEKQRAYEAILFDYHLTEADDGALRVTWQDTIEKYAEYYNLNPAFVAAVIRNESSFRTDAVSSVGARGLMQMMPDTAQWVAGKLNDSYDFDRLFTAETSIRYGCWYLNYLSELFQGDPVLVCAAYHAGQGEVWGWLGNPDISPDGVNVPIQNIPIQNTRTYAGRVTQAYGIYQTLLYPEHAVSAPAASDPHDGSAAALSAAAR